LMANASLPRRREDGEWVSLSGAAAITGCPEFWLVDRCRDGRLPSRLAPGRGVVVPLATMRALVAGMISDWRRKRAQAAMSW
jgi:hypothetical protein